uniref:Uncharacterized protein n=1 Tax=Acrobeloides nanus TaxID=290746 RepID=A0A914DSV3_9BILA
MIKFREDITELFTEIVYNGNKQLYTHWANIESDSEDCHSDLRKSSSHESQMMLLQNRRETTNTVESIA